MSRKRLGVAVLSGVAVAAIAMSAGLFSWRAGERRTGRVAAQGAAVAIHVTVTEGTSMSVAVSPDGRTLAIDLQGSIWTLPAAGGPAKRITDLFSDARCRRKPVPAASIGERFQNFSQCQGEGSLCHVGQTTSALADCCAPINARLAHENGYMT